MHKQHVAIFNGRVEHILKQVVALTLYSQHVHTKALPKVGCAQCAVDKRRVGRYKHLGQPNFVKVELGLALAFLVLKHRQVVVGGKSLHLFAMSQHIKGVVGLQHSVGRHRLLNARAEYGVVGTPHLEYGNAILVAYVELAHGHALKVHAAALSLESEHEVGNVILVQQVGQ